MDPNTSTPDPDAPPPPLMRSFHIADNDDGLLLAEGVKFADGTQVVKWASSELCVHAPDRPPPGTAYDKVIWLDDETLAAENIELRESYGRHALKVSAVADALVIVSDLSDGPLGETAASQLRYITAKLIDALGQRESAN